MAASLPPGAPPAGSYGPPDHAHLHKALKLVSELRAQTSKLWSTAAEGTAVQHGDDGKEKRFLGDLKTRLEAVNANIENLETTLDSRQVLATQVPLGHSFYLSLDAASEPMPGEGGTPLYSGLVSSYKWMDKTRSVAGAATASLAGNGLNRSHDKMRNNQKKKQVASGQIMTNPRVLDDLIGNIARLFPNMKFNITRPNDTKLNAIVEISLERILRTVIVFKGVLLEWIVVRGYEEDSPLERRFPSDGPDVWGESKYTVFRKITEYANAAILHYHHPSYPEVKVKLFIAYLHSFKSIFTDRCKKCGLHLHNNLPPTWREFKTLEPYHEDCRPSTP